ncbi:MAG: glycosyltransferase [Tidjanibacter sp.]|nr:glycosyltransferase [Tidjanibacter sp.]
MESFIAALEWLTEYLGEWGLPIAIVALALFVAQLVYYARRYGRIATYRRRRTRQSEEPPAVSVIVPLFDPDFSYFERVIPKFQKQTHPRFEVIFVVNTPDEEFNAQLSTICDNDYRLSVTKMVYNPRIGIGNKLALNVGIKAAHYDNVIISTQSAEPGSSRWLELMARGFESAEVVLGYCGVAPSKGLSNKMLRCDNLYSSARWLSSAMTHHPYRGSIHNLGLSKSLYFSTGGFNHLSLNMGEDDLYVMAIASAQNTTVVAGPSSVVRRKAWGGLGWWQSERKRLSQTHQHYPVALRAGLAVEYWVRTLFFAANIFLLVTAPLYGKIYAGALILLRANCLLFQTHRLGRRLSERGLMWSYLLYDLLSPIYEAQLWFVSLFRRKKKRWK